jgi:hypothetical protein
MMVIEGAVDGRIIQMPDHDLRRGHLQTKTEARFDNDTSSFIWLLLAAFAKLLLLYLAADRRDRDSK